MKKVSTGQNQSQSGKTWVWPIVVVGAILVGVWFFADYTRDDPDAMNGQNAIESLETADTEYFDEEISEAPDTGITAADILDSPKLYDGTQVVLRAEVEEWLSSRSFLLDAQGVVGDNLLVVTDTPTYVFEDPEIFGDNIWEVTGEVDTFSLTVVRDTLDIDLNPDVFTVYEGLPYVRASSVILYEN